MYQTKIGKYPLTAIIEEAIRNHASEMLRKAEQEYRKDRYGGRNKWVSDAVSIHVNS